MASVAVESRNEINWSQATHQQLGKTNKYINRDFMGKSPFTNPNLNPNRNNSFSRKQISNQVSNGVVDESTSGDAASFNYNKRRESGFPFSYSIRFDISGYTKSELRDLKLQLMAELDKVRNLSSRIDSKKRSRSPFSNGGNEAKRFAQTPIKASVTLMKSCGTVLRKLANQKAGVWFATPVDVVGMGLHDYHTVIDRPMDLGSIKDRLDKGFYDSPEDFAADVRLTFNNALRYNPKGHEVHTFAGQYLALFERWFSPILAKFLAEKQISLQENVARKCSPVTKMAREEVQESSLSKFQSPEPPKILNPMRTPERKPVSPPAPVCVPDSVPQPAVVAPVVEKIVVTRGRKPEGKLPKPKAKDPNKRGMSIDEKRKLGNGLQGLPEEKMAQVILIVRKRNGDLDRDGDEIELDMEALDTETLWELDRLVTNYNKMVSKIARQGLLAPLSSNNVGHSGQTNQAGTSDTMVEMQTKAKKGGGDVGEEDVDIGGEETLANNFLPLVIDKDDDKQHGGGSSNSTSSGSDDSSSSDSDSGFSSGSDSDVDDAQSHDNESKNFPH